MNIRWPVVAAAAALAAAALPWRAATAQEGGADKAAPPAKAEPPAKSEPDDGIRKTVKARRLLKASGWLEQAKGEVTTLVQDQEKRGTLPAGAAAKFEEVADWAGLLDLAVASYVKNVDETVMDAAIVFYESPEGQKFAKIQPDLVKASASATGEFVATTSVKAVAAMSKVGLADKAKGLVDRLRGPKHANETTAIATLRNLTVCQAQLQTSGKIDVDRDGVGEHGTFLELTGAAGTRQSADWAAKGNVVNPAIMAPSLAGVDANGIVVKSGYCFRIYLPDTATPAGFVHETGPADKAGMTGKVWVDLSETTWCAYAWPEKLGDSGQRTFFVNQSGDVMQSPNEIAKWDGPAKAPHGNSALRGAGITSAVAVGTTGQDGDVWKVTN